MLLDVALVLCVLDVPSWAQPKPNEARFAINDTEFQLMFQRKHNGFRSKVAMGTKVGGFEYRPAKNMYRLVFNSYLAEVAVCELNHEYEAPELGRNRFSTVVGSPIDVVRLVERALNSWKKDQSSLSQLMLAKATELGCAFKLYDLLDTDEFKEIEVQCNYDHRLYGGNPYEQGQPCEKSSDCTTYPKRSLCRPKKGLCAIKQRTSSP